MSSLKRGILLALRCASTFEDLVNRARHVKVLLRDVIDLTVQYLAEATHRLTQRNEDAWPTGEYLGNEHRLRQESLDLSCARHGKLVFVAQLFNTENRDDVLEIFVSLQDSL